MNILHDEQVFLNEHLYIATVWGTKEEMKHWIQKGANVNYVHYIHHTPKEISTMMKAYYESPDVVEQHGPPSAVSLPLKTEAGRGKQRGLQQPLLSIAIETCNYEKVQLLLSNGASPDGPPEHSISLFPKIYGLNPAIATICSDREAPVNFSEEDIFKIAELLIQYGAKPGYTDLMTFTMSKNLAGIDFLLKKKIDPNLKDNKGMTVLMGASENGSTDIGSYLT